MVRCATLCRKRQTLLDDVERSIQLDLRYRERRGEGEHVPHRHFEAEASGQGVVHDAIREVVRWRLIRRVMEFHAQQQTAPSDLGDGVVPLGHLPQPIQRVRAQ